MHQSIRTSGARINQCHAQSSYTYFSFYFNLVQRYGKNMLNFIYFIYVIADSLKFRIYKVTASDCSKSEPDATSNLIEQ